MHQRILLPLIINYIRNNLRLPGHAASRTGHYTAQSSMLLAALGRNCTSHEPLHFTVAATAPATSRYTSQWPQLHQPRAATLHNERHCTTNDPLHFRMAATAPNTSRYTSQWTQLHQPRAATLHSGRNCANHEPLHFTVAAPASTTSRYTSQWTQLHQPRAVTLHSDPLSRTSKQYKLARRWPHETSQASSLNKRQQSSSTSRNPGTSPAGLIQHDPGTCRYPAQPTSAPTPSRFTSQRPSNNSQTH
jgi:hypothetical protein